MTLKTIDGVKYEINSYDNIGIYVKFIENYSGQKSKRFTIPWTSILYIEE